MEESRSSNEVVEPYLQMLSSATEYVPEPISTNRGETNDNDHGISIEAITEISRDSRIRSASLQNNIHDLPVMLMEQDKPTNYEEAMVDPKYEK